MTRAPVLILMYHRVDEARDRSGLRVLPDHFVDHLAELRRRADIVPLDEVLRPAPRARAVVTFDDGYADNLHVAQHLLEAADAPATFFITTGILDRAEGFWQDRLATLLLDESFTTPSLEVTVGGRPLWADLRSRAARQRALDALLDRLRRRPRAEIDSVFDDIVEQLGTTSCPPTLPRTLRTDELRQLAARPGATIGAHTVTHPWLSELVADGQRTEITNSRKTLEALLEQPVPTFAYPFGSDDAFDGTSVDLVREAGFDLALQAYGGCLPRRPDRYRLPRVFVGDWDREQFRATIDRHLAAR